MALVSPTPLPTAFAPRNTGPSRTARVSRLGTARPVRAFAASLGPLGQPLFPWAYNRHAASRLDRRRMFSNGSEYEILQLSLGQVYLL